MEEYHDRIIAFHIGRGERFNEPGHITYVPYVECMQDLVGGQSRKGRHHAERPAEKTILEYK